VSCGGWCSIHNNNPLGAKYRYVARLSFALETYKCTNNIAEYEAVILGLRKLRALGVKTCIVKTDSKVIVGQIENDCTAQEPVLLQYVLVMQSLKKQFKGFSIQHVDKSKNKYTDALAKATARDPMPSDVLFQKIESPIVRDPDGHIIISLIMTKDWRAPVALYLQGHYHPTDQAEAKRLKYQSCCFTLIEGKFYKKGICQPLLKCITTVEGIDLLCEVHKKHAAATRALKPSSPKSCTKDFTDRIFYVR
jgi:ribonuclease HI